jgi:cellulose synthase/poly-beta-1,6-N-acetylglucosamine synthase-like glycosyltransferase
VGVTVCFSVQRRQLPLVSEYSQKEFPLNFSAWVRQIHRWLSILFTLTVIANFIAIGFGEAPIWLVYAPLPPLFLLMFSGLYMFALPYAAKWRSGR